MKLSTIWYKANRELTQITGYLGVRSGKEACAMGAIYYYDAIDKSHDSLAVYCMSDMRQNKTLIPAIHRFEHKVGAILDLNDNLKWSFLQFARSARKLKL